MVDFLVVGAGLAGSTCARLLAERGKTVVIVEKRDHIAGNVYDYLDKNQLLIHKYGPHIFHTRHPRVWDFLSRFTSWRSYEHIVKASINGRLLSIPVNVNTINDLYGRNYTAETIQTEFFDQVKIDFSEVTNAAEMIISRVGTEIYELFFKNYTTKQWGVPAEAMDKEVTARIPVRCNQDDRYFDDPYQGIPARGYTEMVEKMLDNENITLYLNVDYKAMTHQVDYATMIYSGPIDYFFDYKYGKLGYRSLEFVFETHHQEYYQPFAQINYPNEFAFTRITEFKHMTGQKSALTTIAKEFPTDRGEPFYPMPMKENQAIYSKYLKESAGLAQVHFIGRLGRYKYANMDVVINEALELVDGIV